MKKEGKLGESVCVLEGKTIGKMENFEIDEMEKEGKLGERVFLLENEMIGEIKEF